MGWIIGGIGRAELEKENDGEVLVQKELSLWKNVVYLHGHLEPN